MASLKLCCWCFLGCISVLAAGQAVFESVFAKQDVPLDLDPALSFCSAARPADMEKDSFGKAVPRYRTEVLHEKANFPGE